MRNGIMEFPYVLYVLQQITACSRTPPKNGLDWQKRTLPARSIRTGGFANKNARDGAR
jgi:hypothetical protein